MKKTKMISVILIFLLLLSLSGFVYASDLDGVGVEEKPQVEVVAPVSPVVNTNTDVQKEPVKSIPKTTDEKAKDNTDRAESIGNMFTDVAIDEKSIQEANAFIRPFAVIMNKIMAGILGITGILMSFVTVLDLSYIALPFVRDMLDGGQQGQQQMQQQGGRSGGGRMGGSRYGGMGGMQGGMGGQQQQQQLGGGMSAIGRWVSDEAIAAALESQGGPMGASTSNGSVKTMVGSYMKKRAFFLMMFGVCAILFTSTVFTDIGVKLGTWLLSLLMGIGV